VSGWRWDGDDLVLELKIQPGARRDAFAGTLGDRQKVQIQAPATDGRANAHLVVWLAQQFGVSRRAVSIESGLASPLKRVRVAAPLSLPADISRTAP
jgi:uncharacterized protein (TIGR00251 family)